MRTSTISMKENAIELLISGLESLNWTEIDSADRAILRQQFLDRYTKDRINKLTKEDYFSGLGRKEGCLSYDLEWGTIKLGSIKGGSKYKYGYESDFLKIKALLQKIISINEKDVYKVDGTLSPELVQIIKLSTEINGFKTGRTVIPKLLSIYFPKTFLPIFNDQDHFIEKLTTNENDLENTGLELYLEYNFKLLMIKKSLEEMINKKLENFEYSRLLYHTFPKTETLLVSESAKITERLDEEKINALEVQHYQSLLHRNFNKIFPHLKYFDEEIQREKNGQYDTQSVGIMDMLAVDENGNFVVIEIKRHAPDKTAGQILRYMGWTQEELCKGGQKVTGLIVAESKDVKLDFALKIVPTIKFLKLKLSITIEGL